MSPFVLRNTHRFKALAFAVQRIESKHTNPLYRERELVVDAIVAAAWGILKKASLAYDGYADFVASGLAYRTGQIDLGTFAPRMTGRYGMFEGKQIWPLVLESVLKDSLLTFDPRAPQSVCGQGEVVSFSNLNDACRLPHASLDAALKLRSRDGKDDLKRQQASIVDIIATKLDPINARIVETFADLPAIATSIDGCRTSDDLFAVFPAVREILEEPVSRSDDRAKTILAGL